MSPPPGGAGALCAICGGPLPPVWTCLDVHPDHCHACYQVNLAGSVDAREHRVPPEVGGLSPRDLAAVVAYQRHVEAVVGTGPLTDLGGGGMTPDDALLQTQTTIRVAARQIMRRYTGHYVGWTLEDLEQEGALGALQACRTFEAARGIPFATFAARRIRGAMWDFIRRAVPGTRRWTVTLVALEEEP